MTSSTTDQVLARAPHRHRHRLRHLVEEQQVQLHCLHVLGQHTCDLFDVFQITCRVYFARGSLQKFHCQFNFAGVPGVLRSETPYWVAFWPRLATDRGGHRWTLQEERHRSPPDLSTPPPPPPTPSLRDLLRDTQAHRDIVSKQTKQTIPQFFSENIIVSRNNGDANRIYLFICFLRRNTPDPHWEPVKY